MSRRIGSAKPRSPRLKPQGGWERFSTVLERLITNFKNIFNIPELRNRILFTLGMLAVYRIGAHIPTPGINNDELGKFLLEKGGALLGFLDIFSGGGLSRPTVFAVGLIPSIIQPFIL